MSGWGQTTTLPSGHLCQLSPAADIRSHEPMREKGKLAGVGKPHGLGGVQPPSIRHHHGRKKRCLRRSANSSSSRAAESRADIRSAVIRKRSAMSCSAPSRSNAARNVAWRLAESTSNFAISVRSLSIWRFSAVAVAGHSSIAIENLARALIEQRILAL